MTNLASEEGDEKINRKALLGTLFSRPYQTSNSPIFLQLFEVGTVFFDKLIAVRGEVKNPVISWPIDDVFPLFQSRNINICGLTAILIYLGLYNHTISYFP